MRDVPIPFEEVRDPQGLNMPDKNLSRDPARTPMQWNDSANGGFSSVKPWLRTGFDYKRVNVEKQKNDPYSPIHFSSWEIPVHMVPLYATPFLFYRGPIP